MADVAAARREARRRRILENSHNRLQLISGKSTEDCSKESPVKSLIPSENFEIPIASESNSSSKSSLNNGVLIVEPDYELLSTSQNIDAAGDGEVANDLAAFLSPTPEPAQIPSFLEKLTMYKYDIVLLSLFIQLLYSLSVVTFDNAYFFLTLIVYVITKLIWFPTQSSSNLTNLVLLLNGISQDRVQHIINITQWVGVISQDVCVFLFTTICTQSLYITIKDSFIT